MSQVKNKKKNEFRSVERVLWWTHFRFKKVFGKNGLLDSQITKETHYPD